MDVDLSAIGALDASQLAFVQADSHNIRLLAPAGSGKTHSLLHRCAEVHRRSAGAASFLIVSFTRAARDELRARLSSPDFAAFSVHADVVTLNGWGHRRLRAMSHQPRLHVSDLERTTMVKTVLSPAWSAVPALEKGMKHQPFKLPKLLANLLDTMKTLGFDHEDGSLRMADDRLEEIEQLGLLPLLDDFMVHLEELGVLSGRRWEPFLEVVLPYFNVACQQQYATGSFTLEDQKYGAWIDQRRQLQSGTRPGNGERISHILIDEFQDINPLDLALILKVAELNDSALTIVGDDDQAIFEWRGAAPDFILEPERYLNRPFATYILEKNYRSPRNIVQKSARLIGHNQRRVPKTMIPVSTTDADIHIFNGETFLDSVDEVVHEIRRFIEAATPNARMALLSRKRAQLIPYQILLAREDIPFCALRGYPAPCRPPVLARHPSAVTGVAAEARSDRKQSPSHRRLVLFERLPPCPRPRGKASHCTGCRPKGKPTCAHGGPASNRFWRKADSQQTALGPKWSVASHLNCSHLTRRILHEPRSH